MCTCAKNIVRVSEVSRPVFVEAVPAHKASARLAELGQGHKVVNTCSCDSGWDNHCE
jgi:hypothetical protein